MRVAFGTDLWARGLETGHLDGIGIYTRELFHELQKIKSLQLTRYQFGPRFKDSRTQTVLRSRWAYEATAAASLLLRRSPFLGFDSQDIALFHATDHHIPVSKACPVLATVMDMIPFTEARSDIKSFFQRLAFKQAIHAAHAIATVSKYSAQQISQTLDIDLSRIHVIPLGVHSKFSEKRTCDEKAMVCKRYQLEPGFLLFVGTLQTRKNISRLLEAYADLPNVLQKRYPLVIVGKARVDAIDISVEIIRATQDMNIHWLQNVSSTELPILMQSARGLVFPSLLEGFGLPVLEGFAAGVPVITSNTTSLPEVAANAAILVDPLSVKELCIAMQRILESGQLCDELIERGAQRVKDFTWQRTATLTHELYQRFL